MKTRLFLLSLFNALALTAVLVFLEIFGVTHFSRYLRAWTEQGRTATAAAEATAAVENDPVERLLLEELEQEKIKAAFDLKAQALNEREAQLSALAQELAAKQEELEATQQTLKQQNSRLAALERERNNREKRLGEIAGQLVAMPPEKAVERLLEIKEDLLILEVLDKIDAQAEENGVISIVPFFYSLMPKEEAARLLRKASVVVE